MGGSGTYQRVVCPGLSFKGGQDRSSCHEGSAKTSLYSLLLGAIPP